MLSLSTIEKSTLTLQIVDALGNQAYNADGSPVMPSTARWEISSPIASIFAPHQSQSGNVTNIGTVGTLTALLPGTATITVSALTLGGTLDIEVVPAPAVGIQIIASTPEVQP